MTILKHLAKVSMNFSQATNPYCERGQYNVIRKIVIFLSLLFCPLTTKTRKIVNHSWRTFFGQHKCMVCESRLGWENRWKDIKKKPQTCEEFYFHLQHQILLSRSEWNDLKEKSEHINDLLAQVRFYILTK